MIYYLKTSIPASAIQGLLKYNVEGVCNTIQINPDIVTYLKNQYNVLPKQLFNSFCDNLNTTADKNLIQIYFNQNAFINKSRLIDVLQFLEYGNLEIQSPRLVSKILTTSLNKTINMTGGI